jgi:hypothetical protein
MPIATSENITINSNSERSVEANPLEDSNARQRPVHIATAVETIPKKAIGHQISNRR